MPKKMREPDIAFWFDEETDRMLVKVSAGVRHNWLVHASFDLLAKALQVDDSTTEFEWTEKEEES